jgi:L-malate glycosyltransferase
VNIVLLIDSLHSIAAGSERQIYKLAEGLTSADHGVRVILLRHSSFTKNPVNSFTENAVSFPCKIECINVQSIASLDAVKKMLALRKQLISENVDVVHAYFPDSCLLAPLFLKTKENRIVTSRRDMGLMYLGKPAWLYRQLRYRTDTIISNSIAVAQLAQTTELFTSQQNKVIYNGLEDYQQKTQERARIYQREDSVKLILVANVKLIKRTLDAVKAVHQLIIQGYNIELALAGELREKDYVQEVERYIAEHNLSHSVHVLGQISEPRGILNQTDIGLLVSESEGFSNTIMEYMQAGLPIIATNVGGNPELVTHNINGFLIEKGDTQQLAAGILQLAQDTQLRNRFSAAGKKRIIEEFTMAAMIKKHEAIYQHATPQSAVKASS